ncbi:MAG: hypothetical protein GY729_17090 [Desulfobacteraceae bacterium]|nr:hypothetical protein [Desulfobacteraceae bacterium]
MPNRKGWFAILFILFTLSIPFAVIYYVSTPTYKERYKVWRERSQAAGIPSKSKVTLEQVLLIKDEKVIVDRTCLVFKGITDKKICMDLYLLELDKEIPYRFCFSKNEFKEGVWLGNIMYRLISAKRTILRLKIENSYHTS